MSKIKNRKKNDRKAFFRGLRKYSHDTKYEQTERPSTGNAFRDAMFNNRGITTNQ